MGGAKAGFGIRPPWVYSLVHPWPTAGSFVFNKHVLKELFHLNYPIWNISGFRASQGCTPGSDGCGDGFWYSIGSCLLSTEYGGKDTWGSWYLYAACSSHILRIHDFSITAKQFVGNVGTEYFTLQFRGSLFGKYISTKLAHYNQPWRRWFVFSHDIFITVGVNADPLWLRVMTTGWNASWDSSYKSSPWSGQSTDSQGVGRKLCTGYNPYVDCIRTSDSRESLVFLSRSGLSPTVF